MKYWLMDRKYWWWHKPGERLLMWFVWKLPRQICYRAAIRVIAHATTDQYGNQEVPALTAMDALKRWDDGQ